MQEAYKIYSQTREVATRTKRMEAPVHHRRMVRLGGGDITVRTGAPTLVSKPTLVKHLAQIKQAQKEGKIVVRTLSDETVDLEAFNAKPVVAKPEEKAKKAKESKASPPPRPPLDSAARDKTFPGGVGEHKPMFNSDGGAPGLSDPPLTITQPMNLEGMPIDAAGKDPAKIRAVRDREEKEVEE